LWHRGFLSRLFDWGDSYARTILLLPSLFAGPCEFEYHDDHLEWDRIKADYENADPRDKER